jgi:uncharacterized sulfatase
MRKRGCRRREFLETAGFAGLACALPSCRSVAGGGGSGRRPNILFCISDDQTWRHMSAYGSRMVATPAFDRVAREGILFMNAFVSAPSCCPSRASVLTGKPFFLLDETCMNHTVWSPRHPIYTDLLAAAGYHVGHTGKGWGPGNWKKAGRKTNPAGPAYNRHRNQTPSESFAPFDYARNFEEFLEKRPASAPFCFWYGGIDPHRSFEYGSGVKNGKRLQDMEVPPYYPDAEEIRNDLADYALHCEWFDRHLGRMLGLLESRGELDNTLIVVTSDNGMAFPRAKATLYDSGTHMPLAIRWGSTVRPGRVLDDFVSFTDFAPTFLEAAGVAVPPGVRGRSLMSLLRAPGSGTTDPARDHVIMGIERHLPGSRKGGDGYPIRAIRTAEYLYIRNEEPDRWPVGDPNGPFWPADDPTGGFGDTDGSPTKTYLWKERTRYPRHYERAFGKRPAEELYLVKHDPYQLKNVAADPTYAAVREKLARRLDRALREAGDPRALGRGHVLDQYARTYKTF